MSKQQFVVGSLLFVCGLVAQAQQSTDWRPNIAEDNKAATLADTMDFLTGTLNSIHAHVGYGGTYYSTSEAVTHDRCVLRFVQRDINYYGELGPDNPLVWSANLQIGQIDPLLLVVRKDSHSPPESFMIHIAGTNNHTVVSGNLSAYGTDGAKVRRWGGGDIMRATTPCMAPDPKHGKQTIFGECQERAFSSEQWTIHFDDLDTSKRFARGLMHAALLCGGTKSVSPF